MKVGDKIKIELEMECTMAPGAIKGRLWFRFADTIVKVTEGKGGAQIGDIGGAMGGALLATVMLDGKGLTLMATVKDQWEAITKALLEQHGIVPSGKARSDDPAEAES